jgi:hypothetical protein
VTPQQAVDRCHRLGQTRPVHIFYMCAADSIEQRILQIQVRMRRVVCSLRMCSVSFVFVFVVFFGRVFFVMFTIVTRRNRDNASHLTFTL